MDTVTVIGPIKGFYHLGFQSLDPVVFRSINEFVNRELAQTMADKMNSTLIHTKGADDGR